MSSEENRKAHCNKCGGPRNHIVLYSEVQNWSDFVEDLKLEIYGADIFTLLKCAGCDSIKILHEDWFSESVDEYGKPHLNETYYPPAVSRPEPRWFDSIRNPIAPPDQQLIAALLQEVYSALHNNSLRLAVMGARALVECIMISKVGDKGSFNKNLDAFQSAGHLSKQQRESIEPILEAGHATIHRGFNPSSEDVNTVIDITEGLIEGIYVNTGNATRLASKVPPR